MISNTKYYKHCIAGISLMLELAMYQKTIELHPHTDAYIGAIPCTEAHTHITCTHITCTKITRTHRHMGAHTHTHTHAHTFDSFTWNDQYYNTVASKY